MIVAVSRSRLKDQRHSRDEAIAPTSVQNDVSVPVVDCPRGAALHVYILPGLGLLAPLLKNARLVEPRECALAHFHQLDVSTEEFRPLCSDGRLLGKVPSSVDSCEGKSQVLQGLPDCVFSAEEVDRSRSVTMNEDSTFISYTDCFYNFARRKRHSYGGMIGRWGSCYGSVYSRRHSAVALTSHLTDQPRFEVHYRIKLAMAAKFRTSRAHGKEDNCLKGGGDMRGQGVNEELALATHLIQLNMSFTVDGLPETGKHTFIHIRWSRKRLRACFYQYGPLTIARHFVDKISNCGLREAVYISLLSTITPLLIGSLHWWTPGKRPHATPHHPAAHVECVREGDTTHVRREIAREPEGRQTSSDHFIDAFNWIS